MKVRLILLPVASSLYGSTVVELWSNRSCELTNCNDGKKVINSPIIENKHRRSFIFAYSDGLLQLSQVLLNRSCSLLWQTFGWLKLLYVEYFFFTIFKTVYRKSKYYLNMRAQTKMLMSKLFSDNIICKNVSM